MSNHEREQEQRDSGDGDVVAQLDERAALALALITSANAVVQTGRRLATELARTNEIARAFVSDPVIGDEERLDRAIDEARLAIVGAAVKSWA